MIYRVSSHTDNVGPGSTYVVIVGTHENGINFIPQAIERGATTVVIPATTSLSHDIIALCKQKNITVLREEDTRRALAYYATRAYDEPAKKLRIIGVTGTDGKTTSAYLVYHILQQAGYSTALLSGVDIFLNNEKSSAQLTTAKPDFLHYFFDQCIQKNITHVVIEVSAQSYTLHRVEGIEFAGLIFTNLAKEHGEFYKTIDDYFDAKCEILRQGTPHAPLIIHDNNEWSQKVYERFPHAQICGIAKTADYQVRIEHESLEQQTISVHLRGTHTWHTVTSPLTGSYNAYNIIGAIGLTHALGISFNNIRKAVETFAGVPGRLQKFTLANGARAIVDYAHTPQAFNAVLPHIRRHTKNKMTLIFGLGGGKDAQKRPLMGQVAAQYADHIILSNDNPRHEDPFTIMDMIMANLTPSERKKFTREPDRKRAFELAYQQASAGDTIALLGMGAEETQIIGTRRIAYSDIAVIRAFM